MAQELAALAISPAFEEDFAVRVAQARGTLSSNDERVIEHVRERLDAVAFHTSESLAQSAGVSRAAVVRFARKLGYTGFTELRDAARGGLRERRESPLGRFSGEDGISLLERKTQQDIKNLAATQGIATDLVGPAARLLSGASSVYVAGNRKSYGLAIYAQRMLDGVRADVRLVDPGFPDDLASLGPKDVLLAMLFRRYSRQTIALIASAKEAGAGVIVITDGRGHDFTVKADHVLAAIADSPTLYESMVAPVWLVEALVAETAAVDRERSRSRLQQVERFVEDQSLLLD